MRNLTMPNVHVETRLLEAEYELLKDFKEKNGLKTDYQGLKELVKALDIPEFKQAQNTQFTPVDTFVFYDTQGHGYLRVRKELLDGLGLTDKISRYSYTDPKKFWVYLEEDNDLGIFLKKLDKKSLEELNYTTKHVKEDYFDIEGLNYPFYKQEVKPIDRTNLENWVKDLGFEQPQNETQVTASYRRIGVQTGQSIERLWDILFWLQEQTHTNLNVPQINTISPLLKQITDEFKKITNDGFSLGLSTALKPNVGSHYVETQTRKEIQKDTIIPTKGSRIRTAKGYKDFDKHRE